MSAAEWAMSAVLAWWMWWVFAGDPCRCPVCIAERMLDRLRRKV